MILLYEQDLQRVSGNSNLALPYWDWAADQNSGTSPAAWKVFQVFSLGAKTNIGFGADGDASGNVQTGSFRVGAWQIVDDQGVLVLGAAGNLQREFGKSGATTLPTPQDVSKVNALAAYDTAPWDGRSSSSFRNSGEGWASPTGVAPGAGPQMHNRVHVWLGGSMLPMTSPNDPIFFLHHCNVDRLWSLWPNASSYLPASAGPPGHNLKDPMWPWDGVSTSLTVTPASVLDTKALGYQYA
jgi:tyrosinase